MNGTTLTASTPGTPSPGTSARAELPRATATRGTIAPTPVISAPLLAAFTAYSRWYVRRHFHSVRISVAGPPPVVTDLPVVIYVNHASWWDPLICLLLQAEFFGSRRAFAPMDAAALRQYRFFARLGFFGVEQRSARGAVQFLRTATALLAQPRVALWLTPQGRFADVRERLLHFKAGLGHLPARIGPTVFVPLALEYVFWEERKPEVLCRFGPAEILGTNAPGAGTDPRIISQHFEQQLQAAQDALAVEAQRRQPAEFRLLLHGGGGVGWLYDAWRALRAKATGESFRREHGRL
jgi:1-acyl-sn-glycerol-3-phosphate acyltransferase